MSFPVLKNRDLLLEGLPFAFAAILFAYCLAMPPLHCFDEIHYIKGAKNLMDLRANTNWEHPPLAKIILGLSWLVFNQWTELLDEFSSFRIVAVLFSLLSLTSFRLWVGRLGFSKNLSQALVWTVVFNIAWFVQSKTAMLDIFFICFAFWGLYGVVYGKENKTQPWLDPGLWGWISLGLALGCKWSALPFPIIALIYCFFSWKTWNKKRLFLSLICSFFAYFLCFWPLFFIKEFPLHILNFFNHQRNMLQGLASTSEVQHPYKSQWWKWPTLIRPMWYTFEKVQGIKANANYVVFMGGNPLLFWVGNASFFFILITMAQDFLKTKKIEFSKKILISLFTLPLLIWILAPRKLMYFYYMVPSSFWYGPMIFMVFKEILTEEQIKRVAWSFVIAEALIFLVFLPITSGHALSLETFNRFYQHWMWRLDWI